MTYSLDSARLKLSRARFQLHTLMAEMKIATNMGGRLFDFETQVDSAGEWDYLIVKIAPVHPGWSLLVGEVAHHTRSALDYLVWEAVKANGGQPDRYNAFPVAYRTSEWADNVDNRGDQGFLHGVSDRVYKAIKAEQPYDGRNEKAAKKTHLAILNEVNRADKHRALPVVLMPVVAKPKPLTVTRLDGSSDTPQTQWLVKQGSLLHDGAPLMRSRTTTRMSGARTQPLRPVKVKVEGAFPFEIAFEYGTGMAIGWSLFPQIIRVVEEIIGRVEAAF